jgi:O-antigen chain-terminating methyltransferase
MTRPDPNDPAEPDPIDPDPTGTGPAEPGLPGPGALRAELALVRAELAQLREQVERLTRAPGRRQDGAEGRLAAVYPAFEDRFRGSEREVRERLAGYLPVVLATVRAGPDTGPRVADVGPGRGEWLAMLADDDVAAVGIEDNAAMVARLRDRGLDAVHADAVAHLRTVPPGSLDVVTAFHVVEHLEPDDVLALLAAARDALRPGGLLVAETPDPTNLVMGACNFHLDPTHRAPVPPAQLEFLVSAGGFVDVETWRLHPKEDVDLSGLRLPGIDATASALVADALQRGLFGTQDHAVLARAPALDPVAADLGRPPR